jgi:hypothetical protein
MNGEMKHMRVLDYSKKKLNLASQKDQVLLFNSCFKFSAGKLASTWQGPLIMKEVYHSGAIHLHGDYKGKPHVVNGKLLKYYIAGEKFIGKVEELNL